MDNDYADYLSDLVDDRYDEGEEDPGVDEVYDPEPREDFGFFGDEALCGE